MRIQIDRLTNKVAGINQSPTPLYLEVEVNEDFILEKSVEMTDELNPLIEKRDLDGNILYKDNLVKNEATGEEGYDEVHYEDGKKPIAFEEKEVTNTHTDEDGVERTTTSTVQVATEWEELEPVMIDNIVPKTISIKDSPTEFTIDEVLTKKYQKLLDDSQSDYLLANIFLNEEDIDTKDPNHTANTGVGILELLPKGEARTKEITLLTGAKDFTLLEFNAQEGVDIYINGTKFVDGKVSYTTNKSKVYVKFVNTGDKPRVVKNYAIGY